MKSMTEAGTPAGHRLPRHHLDIHAAGVAEVIEAVYDACLFEQANRSYRYERNGEEAVAEWALDLRRPLSQSAFLRPVATAMNEELRRLGIHQVAGQGFGSFALVGGMVAAGHDLRSVLIRSERKRHGFQEILEGSIDTREPVAIVNDLLSTGTHCAQVGRDSPRACGAPDHRVDGIPVRLAGRPGVAEV